MRPTDRVGRLNVLLQAMQGAGRSRRSILGDGPWAPLLTLPSGSLLRRAGGSHLHGQEREFIPVRPHQTALWRLTVPMHP